MTKIDIFSGFLGAGKTTLIKKLLREAYAGEKLVLIENEFGEIGIDGGFMQDAGIEVTEMNSGCICCSLVGDFGKALAKVLSEYHPDRILIEPSGVGKLSDIIRAVQNVAADNEVLLNGFTTVADVKKCKMYMKNFGEFFNDQIENAGCIVLSHTQDASEDKIAATVDLLREHNPTATIVTTPWESLDGLQLLAAMERRDTIEEELARLEKEAHHHHDHECDDPDCSCHHHEHEHHHHDHECDDPDCSCHHHEHEHHHHDHECDDPDCSCHHHEHEHHYHHADDVFVSWGVETTKTFGADELAQILERLPEEKTFGTVLRAKGIVAGNDGSWLHFDYIPGESDIRVGSAGIIGRLCVIGSHINKEALAALFGTSVH